MSRIVASAAAPRATLSPGAAAAPELVRAPDARAIEGMMEPYLHELVPGGPARYPQLDLYWRDANRMPYLIRVDGADVGFALVRRHPPVPLLEMAEFYVQPRFRRLGLGTAAARAVLARHPGWWHLQVLHANHAAQAFWRVIVPPGAREEAHVAANGRRFTLLRFHYPDLADAGWPA